MEGVFIVARIMEFLGTFILAALVFRVHSRVKMEKRIDDRVLLAISREKIFGLAALILILFGFILEISWHMMY